MSFWANRKVLVTGGNGFIGDLAALIIKLADTPTQLKFDDNEPIGQTRRLGDYTKAKKLLGFESKISLEEGLARTISWYKGIR